MIRKTLLALTAALMLAYSAAAQDPGSDVSPATNTQLYGVQEFHPTALHETAYYMMQFCTGVYGDFQAVRWYTAKALIWEDGNTRRDFLGMWHKEWGWPSIIFERDHVFDGLVVGHEILHDLYGGQVPMDIAARCLLDWPNLTPIERDEPFPPK